jgi:diguanylate cyclase (GGDEF)-like protein
MTSEATVFHKPDRDYIRSFLFVRWLLVILAAYLTFFTYVQTPTFKWVVLFIVVFATSNVAYMFLPHHYVRTNSFQRVVVWVDGLFGCAMFYLLRVPDTYLYLPFMLIFVMAAVRRDLKVVAFSVIAVSLFYGMFSLLRIEAETSPDWTPNTAAPAATDLEQFLALSLFFVAAIFYLFLSDRLRQDADLSGLLHAEHRRAEIMAEITRSFSSSLNSQEILYLIVTRLSEVFDSAECSIVRLDADSTTGRLLVRSAQPDVRDREIDLGAHPEIRHANIARDLLFVPEVQRDGMLRSVIVMPMLVQDSVLGIIHVQLNSHWGALSDTDARFFRIMSATAANALNNAHLFEEMEHKARTDYLTGLLNHRFFQTALGTELTRAQRHNHPLSLLLVDLDHLKDVNDRFGHPAGDAVIREVAETIRMTCRNFDFAARYGGEEFAVILPETPLEGAIQTAERIRERISLIEFSGVGHVTASIGIANYPVNALGKEDLIRVADRALYIAKNNGRNRVAYFNYQLVARAEA